MFLHFWCFCPRASYWVIWVLGCCLLCLILSQFSSSCVPAPFGVLLVGSVLLSVPGAAVWVLCVSFSCLVKRCSCSSTVGVQSSVHLLPVLCHVSISLPMSSLFPGETFPCEFLVVAHQLQLSFPTLWLHAAPPESGVWVSAALQACWMFVRLSGRGIFMHVQS